MCLQCVVESEVILEDVFGGYQLQKATNYNAPDEWPHGWYGLVKMNDPEFVFSGELVEDTEENFEKVNDTAWHIRQYLSVDLRAAWRIVEAAKLVGYDPSKGPFEEWFVDRCAKMLKKDS